MVEITELQRKRAENIIWNCAQDYHFTPGFKAFDSEGLADLYWNCIIGAVRRHYEYEKIEAVLRGFQQYEESDTYEGLFWIGIENCVFPHELEERPVLASLRLNYAQAFVKKFSNVLQVAADDYHLMDAISFAHWQRVLGQKPVLSKYDISLLDELEFSPEMTTDEIVAKTEELFSKWFMITTEEKKKEKRHFVLPGIKKREAKKGKGRFRRFGIGIADHPQNAYGGSETGEENEQNQLATKLTAGELRAFMETKYGRPIYTPKQIADMERSMCSGNHKYCHLHFTNGERIDISSVQNGFEAISRQREAAQIIANKKFYSDNLVRNHEAISKLSGKISNSVLLHLQPATVKANSGSLTAGRVWRATELNDSMVFTKRENDNMGDLSVDILLDASTSQQNRQEIISSQAYIIAESLTRCGIPCRLMSFCSMTGYTIIRIFRDYTRPQDNSKVFDFVSNGCNRDGLAIRAAHELINKEHYDHRILIILSDVKPNDVIRIYRNEEEKGVPYERTAGITDTSLEVRRAIADGISVLCIFTGEDEDVPAAKTVYGRDFVRIRSFDMLADTVGNLLRNKIRNL